MILFVLVDGLTTGGKVYKKGELFRLPQERLNEVTGLGDEQLARKLKKVYGEVVYRRATEEEIMLAHSKKEINVVDISMQDKRERLAIATQLRSQAHKKLKAAEMLEESFEEEGMDEVIEKVVEKKEEAPTVKKKK